MMFSLFGAGAGAGIGLSGSYREMPKINSIDESNASIAFILTFGIVVGVILFVVWQTSYNIFKSSALFSERQQIDMKSSGKNVRRSLIT